MRRKDREVTDFSEIIEIMKNCDVCRLALNDDGFPYILPLNFGMAVNGDKITLYFHSALEGYKVGLIQKDNRASFEMDCNLNVMCDQYGIALDHHKADSDARACAEILLRYMESGVDVSGYVKEFVLSP